jgi:hypothetical protein
MLNNEARIIAGYMDAHLGSALEFQFGQSESKDRDYMDGYHMGRTEGMLSQYLAVGALDVDGYMNLNVRKCFQ